MVITALYFIGLLFGFIAVKVTGGYMTTQGIATIMLQYFFLISVGLTSVIGFYGHVFMGKTSAKLLGWPPDNPFQKEVGFWDLAGGVGAILAFWKHGEFWLAVIIITTIFWTLAGMLHLKHVISNKNYHLDNLLPSFTNFLIPITLIVLYIVSYR